MNRWGTCASLTMAGACALAASPCAAAGKATLSMPVSVNVTRSCSVSATPMAFTGFLGFLDRDATATILVQCSPNVPFTVAIDNGLNATGTTRRVRNVSSATYLTYDVFTDAARSSRWGATAATDVAGNSGGSGIANLTAYGRLQAGTSLLLGQYTDSLTITLTF